METGKVIHMMLMSRTSAAVSYQAAACDAKGKRTCNKFCVILCLNFNWHVL